MAEQWSEQDWAEGFARSVMEAAERAGWSPTRSFDEIVEDFKRGPVPPRTQHERARMEAEFHRNEWADFWAERRHEEKVMGL